jgi:copper homeostasis protein
VRLEVIVQSVADARAAEAGGADRLEVVREIERDGLTPPLDLVRAIAAETRLPLRVMVRESDGFGVSGARELMTLQQTIATLASLGIDGAVLGFARGNELDLETTRSVLAAAPDQRVTFHRAFDAIRDQMAAIEALRELPQIDRILSSGGEGPWEARCARFADFVVAAGDRLMILAGGGVDATGLRALVSSGCVREAHIGRAAREPPSWSAPVSVDRVRQLRAIADEQPRDGSTHPAARCRPP